MDLSKLSDAELQALASGGSPDDISSMSDEQLKALAGEDKMSAAKAARIGAEDAATFGARGFLSGVGGAIGQAAGAFSGLEDMPLLERLEASIASGKKGFSEARQEAKQEKEKALDDQLAASLLGSVGGSILTAPLTLGKGLAGALAMGGATGTGTALSDADSLEQAAMMAGGGALTGAGMFGLGKGLTQAAKGVKSLANKTAFSALSPLTRDARNALSKGTVEDIGAAMLDEGVIGFMPKTYNQIADKLVQKTDEAGLALGQSIDVLDDLAKSKGLYKYGVRPQEVVTKALEDVRVPSRLPGAARENKQYALLAKEFSELNKSPLGLKDSEQLKREVADRVNWERLVGTDIPIKEKFDRALAKALKDEGEQKAMDVAGLAKKEMSAAFKKSKNRYSLLAPAKEMVTDKTARDLANRIVSPSDTYAAGVGALAGAGMGDDPETRIKNAIYGAGLGLANRYMRTGGVQNVAKGADVLSKIMKVGGKAAPALTPAVVNFYNSLRQQGAQDE